MAGRKPKPPEQKKSERRDLNLTPSDLELARELAEQMGVSEQELYRRGLYQLAQKASSGEIPMVMMMSGDAEVIAQKKKALEAFRVCGTAAVAADRAGVTARTIYNWSQTDPVFEQLAREAQALTLGRIRARMYEDAMAGNTLAQQTLLNNLDPTFGSIRKAMIQRIIQPFMDQVLESARRYLSDSEFARFSADVGRTRDDMVANCGGKR